VRVENRMAFSTKRSVLLLIFIEIGLLFMLECVNIVIIRGLNTSSAWAVQQDPFTI